MLSICGSPLWSEHLKFARNYVQVIQSILNFLGKKNKPQCTNYDADFKMYTISLENVFIANAFAP